MLMMSRIYVLCWGVEVLCKMVVGGVVCCEVFVEMF